MADRIGIVIHAGTGPGILHQITGVIARHEGDIASVDILDSGPHDTRVYFEIVVPGDFGPLVQDVLALAIVHTATMTKSVTQIYGKRIIIIGGGAQVGQVAIGAISEADRHNIRGE